VNATILGVPYYVWGSGFLVLAVVWIFDRPLDRAAAPKTLRFVVLRWFHVLVWILLGIASLVAGSGVLGGPPASRAVALLSLILYLAFVFTLLTSPRKS